MEAGNKLFCFVIIIIFFNVGLKKRHSVTDTDTKEKGNVEFFFSFFFFPVRRYALHAHTPCLCIWIADCYASGAFFSACAHCASSMRAPGEEQRRLRQQRREPTIQPAGRSSAAAPPVPLLPPRSGHGTRATSARSLSRNARTHQTDTNGGTHTPPRRVTRVPIPLFSLHTFPSDR